MHIVPQKFLPVKNPSDEEKRDIYMIAEMKLEFAKFLNRNGKKEASALYEQSSRLWEGLVDSSTVSDDLREIADLEEQDRGCIEEGLSPAA